MRGTTYQYTLITLGVLSSALLGVFFYREIFPEYRIYQNDYIAIEKFRSSYTHEPPPLFKPGIKQILIEAKDKGNPTIDRCTSCHVALEFPHFSPTKIAYDINGNMIVDAQGIPQQVKNPDYVWEKIDQKITELTDEKVIAQLQSEGNQAQVNARLKETEELKALKVAHVDEQIFDVTKVLAMHPLIGKETRPFEFHPLEDYGCTSCHNGNGRGITTLSAHGPVFDGQYEKEFMGETPQFTEVDPDNDPRFARVFNGKPGHKLLFQTTPLYTGALLQAKCMQCHQTSGKALENVVDTASAVTSRRQKRSDAVYRGLQHDEDSVLTILNLEQSLNTIGLEQTLSTLKQVTQNYTLPAEKREQASAQLIYLQANPQNVGAISAHLQASLQELIGSPALVKELSNHLRESKPTQQKALDTFIESHKGSKEATGSIFAKLAALDLERQIEQHIKDVNTSFQTVTNDPQTLTGMTSDIDRLTSRYQRGQELFIAQSCYACHRIAGFSRGGVGPELTQAGEGYPWFIKESIVWPQADLHTSTMPNFMLDHEELEDLVTYLLGQTGSNQSISSTSYKAALQQWEAGHKQAWEKPINPVQMRDLRYAMTTFATEGCAACHRLKGFDSNVGFRIEKAPSPPSFKELQNERNWFQTLIPEQITGSELVKVAETHAKEIDAHIADDVRTDSLLESIETSHPGLLESYYTPFKFASRAKNAYYASLIHSEKDPNKKTALSNEHDTWKQRIHNLMLLFAQEYGLGRLIGPRPNWSGIFRTDEWLMEHFKNPAAHVPRSIMPVFPFDDTKFYALTLMLDTLALKNRDETRTLWKENGFNPEIAYQIHCAQCHGEYLQGNGPVATWIYPIPKNLRNAEFLRNLTKEVVIESIAHGVKGTPMPPWGEVAANKPEANQIPVLTKNEIHILADWLFSSLPGGNVIRNLEDVPKWNYDPEEIIQELRDEGNYDRFQKSVPKPEAPLSALEALPKGDHLWASLAPPLPMPPKDAAHTKEKHTTIFDIVKDPSQNIAPKYYIKKQYYTPENIKEGQAFFELNCAVCHGKEADGAGMRAGAMMEAKPRMLTNLDWINTRDDLRLLRSIKYGVAGTAMNPWGDLTSGLQRLQLVMFIRSLTDDKALQEQFMGAIYAAFDAPDLTLELARSDNYQTLKTTRELYHEIQQKRNQLYSDESTQAAPDLKTLYEQERSLQQDITKLEQQDARYLKLKALNKKEKELYLTGGKELIQNQEIEALDLLIQTIQEVGHRYQQHDHQIYYHLTNTDEIEIRKRNEQILKLITTQLETLSTSKESEARLKALKKLKNTLTYTFAETERLRQQEQQLTPLKEPTHG